MKKKNIHDSNNENITIVSFFSYFEGECAKDFKLPLFLHICPLSGNHIGITLHLLLNKASLSHIFLANSSLQPARMLQTQT